ncbi:MAG: OmpA family protein [Pseudorhodobacter sp.]
MLKQTLPVCVFAAAFALAGLAPVFSQSNDAASQSAEELTEKFQRQKTRGLKRVDNDTTSVVVPTTTAEGRTEVAAVAYTQVEEEDQVNIRIDFDFDSSVLRTSEKPKLATLCEAMKTVDVDLFRIVGHTDATGSDAYNEKLSLLRAEEVKRFLVNDCGIQATRLEAVGMGKRFLLNSEEPAADENRRVEFQALS